MNFFDISKSKFLCQPVGSFGDKLLCQCLINFNYSSTWIFLLRKDASSSEMEIPSDISQEFPLHKNSVTRVWTLNSDLQFREWATCLWAFVVEWCQLSVSRQSKQRAIWKRILSIRNTASNQNTMQLACYKAKWIESSWCYLDCEISIFFNPH